MRFFQILNKAKHSIRITREKPIQLDHSLWKKQTCEDKKKLLKEISAINKKADKLDGRGKTKVAPCGRRWQNRNEKSAVGDFACAIQHISATISSNTITNCKVCLVGKNVTSTRYATAHH